MFEIITKIFNISSPIFGAVGTILVFIYGIPRNLGLESGKFLVAGNQDNSKDIAKFKRRSNLGLILIFISFLLQFFVSISAS